jgi:hypothetical protein
MSLPKLGTTKEGTVAFTAAFPWPWPPAAPLTARCQLSDGFIVVELGCGIAIRASVVQADGEKETVRQQAISCPLVVEEGALESVAVTWKIDDAVKIYVGGKNATLPIKSPCILLKTHRPDPLRMEDFSEKNESLAKLLVAPGV